MIVLEDCFATSLTARSKESYVRSEMPCSLSCLERLEKERKDTVMILIEDGFATSHTIVEIY